MSAGRMGEEGVLIRLRDAGVAFGARRLWQDLTLEVARGEFLAVLGPNGSGKTTLLHVLLGLQPLAAGTVEIDGRAAPSRRPPPRLRAPAARLRPRPARAGTRPRAPGPRRAPRRTAPAAQQACARRVDAALAAVGAADYANAPIGRLSGGEQQRLRIAQALLGDPLALLCDEPLLSLDLAHQQAMTALLDEQRRDAGTAIVFVTHEINPILPYADRVLYLVGGRWAVGTPEEVLTSARLSALYGAPVEVVRLGGRILVAAAEESDYTEPEGHTHHLEQGRIT